jgi:hypothetical protein
MKEVTNSTFAILLLWLGAGGPAFSGNPAMVENQSFDGRTLIAPTPSRQQTPTECRGIPLGNFVPGKSPVPSFWNTLSLVLRERGFSTSQVKKVQEMFGHLDAVALQNLASDQLLPAMTGHTQSEKQQKAGVLLAAAGDVESCLTALALAKT